MVAMKGHISGMSTLKPPMLSVYLVAMSWSWCDWIRSQVARPRGLRGKEDRPTLAHIHAEPGCR